MIAPSAPVDAPIATAATMPVDGVLGMTAAPSGGAAADQGLGGWLGLASMADTLLGPLATPPYTVPKGIGRRISDDRLRQLISLADLRPDLAWVPGRSIALARNAHTTNSAEQLQNALMNDYDWLEGDVRIDADGTVVMAHDRGERGGLSLDEWLAVGIRAGRGLKLDIKEAAAILPVVRRAHELGVPDSKIIINVSVKGERDSEMTHAQLATVRRLYPRAIINLGVASPGYDDDVIQTLTSWAREAGQPVMFPIRLELATDEVIRRLKPHGRIAIWNAPTIGAPTDVRAETAALRARGVDGMIDLRTAGTWERLAQPFIHASLTVLGWGATVGLLRVGAFLRWLALD